MSLTSILCAVDFSDGSRQALRWAAALAVRDGARLVVMSAIEPLLVEAARVRAGIDLVREQIAPALDAFVAEVLPPGASWRPATTTEVLVGHAADATVAEAGRQSADLIVIGTQGLGGFRKLLLGSTTEQVLRRTRTPVLAVPFEPDGAVVVDSGGARLAIETLLAVTDFSRAAAAAVAWAADTAGRLSLPLVLAHVVPETKVPASWQLYARESDEQQVAQARAKLERLAKTACPNRECRTVVAIGAPADAIAALAQEHRAGLIAMGLTGKPRGFARRPGSVAYQVLVSARVPVLVVPRVG